MMRKVKNLLPAIFLMIVFVSSTSFYQGSSGMEKISASMLSRQVQKGKTVTIKGEIYYRRNGNLITHFSYPKEYVIIGNKFGETKIYDVAKNSVISYQNFVFSTQSTQFFYFFSGKFSDMGLNEIGFVQDKSYYENGFMVTEWHVAVPQKKDLVQRVKLVFDKENPIYIDYRDAKGTILRKVFYYNYTKLANYNFPAITTEIIYDGRDSTVSKTSYTDFKVNENATSKYFDFTIPANAKSE